MANIQVVNPYQNFVGLNAVPVQNGYIYIGEENKDPESYPQAVYWDSALTIPASQPIRTTGGYIANAGTPGQLFTAAKYSIRVKDSTGSLVFYAASSAFSGNYLPLSGGAMTGVIDEYKGADIASSTLTDIGAATGNYVTITGTTTITALGTAQAGAVRTCRFAAALTITHNATSLILPGGANITTAAGDVITFRSEGGGNWRLASYAYVPSAGVTITASVASNALTIGLNSCPLSFRSTTLTSGAPVTRLSPTISLTVPSGATLGTVNAIQSRLVYLAIDNAGTVELAIVNLSGGNNLDETTLISTTAISGTANSANVIYSTTARSNVAFRVVGFIDITEATAGTWATAPTLVQPQMGQAISAMSSIGYGQTLQDVTGSRALSTTYYNTTGRPIKVNFEAQSNVAASFTMSIYVNGAVTVRSNPYTNVAGQYCSISETIPPGASYSFAATNAVLSKVTELR